MSLLAHLEGRRSELEQYRENSARTARVTLRFASSGHGELRLKKATRFGISFLERPTVTTGVEVVGGQLVVGKFPNVCAGVYEWKENDSGLFVAAKMFFVVDSGGQPYSLEHHVVFEAPAIKLMPGALS